MLESAVMDNGASFAHIVVSRSAEHSAQCDELDWTSKLALRATHSVS